MNKRLIIAAAMAFASVTVPAAAQWSGDGEAFVKAVREKDGDKALEILRDRRGTVIDARDSKGETALIVAIQRRDLNWTGYLLREGANPNLGARNGDTPLIAAARSGFEDAAVWLIDLGAKVDQTNRAGETPLIVAVQQRNADLVRFLLANGADPDKTDSVAGYSARDYAKRDARSKDILALLDSTKAKAKPVKPSDNLDDFKLQ